MAITDHGSMYGVVDFYKAAKAKGIHPIIGCEVYVSPRKHTDKIHEFDSENRHLVLLCKNNTGYQNLAAMVSEAWINGFYNKPRVDDEMLEAYSEGLIALSACLAGDIPRALVRGDYDAAKEKALKYNRIFGQGEFLFRASGSWDPGTKADRAHADCLVPGDGDSPGSDQRLPLYSQRGQ